MLDLLPKVNTVCCAKTAASPATSCLPALFFLQDSRLELAEAIETLSEPS